MARGFLYLVAIMDWHSRQVVAWRLSNTLEAGFCAEALEDALGKGQPGVFNTDQSLPQRRLGEASYQPGVHPGPAGPRCEDQHGWEGGYSDNIFVERLWRTVKYEEVYLKA